MTFKLKKPLPSDRSLDQVLNHYKVEKAIADKLKASTPEERQQLNKTMYQQLFAKVPDHPRLTRRTSEQQSETAINRKMHSVHEFLDNSITFAEFGAGDCRFANEVAKQVKRSVGLDISDQRPANFPAQPNFKLITYDGHNLHEVEEGSIDFAFSDQLIEHLHLEDVKVHLGHAYRLLKSGGKYFIRTPHQLTGPHDVSQYFSDEPECFHLKEWTYHELTKKVREAGFSDVCCYRYKKQRPYPYFWLCEHVLGWFPKRVIRGMARYLMPSLDILAIK